MSDKSKLSYYFTRTIEIPLQEPSDTYTNATVNVNTGVDIENATGDELCGGGELDEGGEIPQCSSAMSALHDRNEVRESVDTDDLLQASATDRNEQLISLGTDSYKRDPGRGPAAAKEFVLLGAYQPNIKFPTNNHRHFCHAWYQSYSWLEFSEMTKKSYCFVCRFAYSEGRFEKGFTIYGFNNWRMAITKFNKHQASSSHKHANILWLNARKNYQENNDVLKQVNKQYVQQCSENRCYLKEIIRTILFLARQGLAFRGHREDDESENKGRRCFDRNPSWKLKLNHIPVV